MVLTEVIATSSSIHAPLPAAFMYRHLKSHLVLLPGCFRAEIADLQLGKVLLEVRERHPTTDDARSNAALSLSLSYQLIEVRTATVIRTTDVATDLPFPRHRFWYQSKAHIRLPISD